MAFVHGAITRLLINGYDWSSVLREVTLYRGDNGNWKIAAEGYFDTALMQEIQDIPRRTTNFELQYGTKHTVKGDARVENVKIHSGLEDATLFRISLADLFFDNEVFKDDIRETTTLGCENKTYEIVDDEVDDGNENVVQSGPFDTMKETLNNLQNTILTTYCNPPSTNISIVSANLPPAGYKKPE
jgi:hypothetical protein